MPPKPKIIVYWSRCDFRLHDNQALYKAIKSHTDQQIPFFGMYVLQDNYIRNSAINVGYNRRFFISQILANFALEFDYFNIFTGKPTEVFKELSSQYQLEVYFNQEIEPYSHVIDQQVMETIAQNGGQVFKFNDNAVDYNIKSGSGSIYSVYTPFKNAVIEHFLSAKVYPPVAPKKLNWGLLQNSSFLQFASKLPQIKLDKDLAILAKTIFSYVDGIDILTLPTGLRIDMQELVPRQDLASYWYFKESEAIQKLDNFLEKDILNYKIYRDDLALDATLDGKTSRLSPALKWGLLSSKFIITRILAKYPKEQIYADSNLLSYVNELIWREFYRYILVHNPQVLDTEFQAKYRGTIKWIQGEEAINRFKLWIQGKTGYEVVDAAMMQIAQTGWMHNRARMIVASILTKNLGIDWRWGQDYFRFLLVDLDEASNCGGWQWAASVGSDPKPIRIFNPYLQAENYDKNQAYRNKWLPKDYNFLEPPIVEHKIARDQALLRYGLAKTSTVRDY